MGRLLNLPADALTLALNDKAERLPGMEEGARLLLVVDQYEELYTVARAKQRKQFEQALLRLTDMPDTCRILAARADFYANLMTSPLWPAINQHRLEITPPHGDALRQAITLPARDVGVELEAELVERLLADAGDEPGVLPFIQETLVMLWVHADKFSIGLAPYTHLVGDKSGRSGLQVALAEHAEHVYWDELANDGERSLAVRILVRLIQFGEGRADTRRQQTVDDLRKGTSKGTDFDHVLAVLTANRLLTLSDEERRVDLSHETLIRGWARLNEWIDQRRAAELTRRRLEEKAGERRRLRQQDEVGGLLDVVELAEAEAWVKGAEAPELGVSEELRALVDDSRRAIDAALQAKAEAAQRELEQARKLVEERTAANRKLRRRAQLAVAVGALALLAAAIAIISYASAQSEAQNARKAEATAVAEANARSTAQAETAKQLSLTQIGESRLLNTLAEQQLTQDPVAAIHLSLRALPSETITRPLVAEAQATLAQALRTSQERKYLPLLSNDVLSHLYLTPKQVAFHPARSTAAGTPRLIAVSGDQPYIADPLYIVDSELISVTSGQLGTGNLLALAWGDDDKLLVAADNRVDIWQEGKLVAAYPPANAQQAHSMTRSIACAVWRPATGEIAICRHNQILLWNPEEEYLQPLAKGFPGHTSNAIWSPHGSRLAAWNTGAQTSTLWIGDVHGNTQYYEQTLGASIARADWSGNNDILVTATTSDTATIWNLASEPVTRTINVCSETRGVYFLDDGNFVVWSNMGAPQLWNTDGERLSPTSLDTACPSGEGVIANLLPLRDSHTPDRSELLLKLYEGGAVELWDPLQGTNVWFRDHTMTVLAADLWEDYLATGAKDGTIRVWDAATGKVISVLRGHQDVNGDDQASVVTVQWLDDQRLLSAGEDGSLRIWQVFDSEGEPLCTRADERGPPICVEPNSTLRQVDSHLPLEEIRSAAWLNDDEIAAFSDSVLGTDFAVRWNIATGEVFTVPIKNAVTAFWLADGILLSDEDGNVRMLDPQTAHEMSLPGHVTQVTAAALHPSGLLATGDLSDTIHIWDMDDNELLATWKASSTPTTTVISINTLQWSEDGRRLLSASDRVRLWELGKTQAVLVWPAAERDSADAEQLPSKWYAALAPGGEAIAAASAKTVHVLDATTLEECWSQTDMYGEPIRGVQWVAKGQWPQQVMQEAVQLTPGCESVRAQLLLTWSGDGTAKVWDGYSNAAVLLIGERPKEDLAEIDFAAASPNGDYLFTAGKRFQHGIKGVIRHWRAWYQDPQALLDEAAQVQYMTRPLAPAQLAAFSVEQ